MLIGLLPGYYLYILLQQLNASKAFGLLATKFSFLLLLSALVHE